VGQKKLGIEDLGLLKAMASMGGGIASSGGPCGALIGGIALLGSLFGRDTPENPDHPAMWKAGSALYRRFETEVAGHWGSVNCRDITGVDWRDRDQTRAFYRGEGRFQCAENTGKTARILGELLDKYMEADV
jgi:C_GCAxxG_C_C family probable redox protein